MKAPKKRKIPNSEKLKKATDELRAESLPDDAAEGAGQGHSRKLSATITAAYDACFVAGNGMTSEELREWVSKFFKIDTFAQEKADEPSVF